MKKLFTSLIFTLLTLLSFSQTEIYFTGFGSTDHFSNWQSSTSTGPNAQLQNSQYLNGLEFIFFGLYGVTTTAEIVKTFSYSNDSYFIDPLGGLYSNTVRLEVGYATTNNQIVNSLEIYTSTDSINWVQIGTTVYPILTTTGNFFINLHLDLTSPTHIKILVTGSITSSMYNTFRIEYVKLLGTSTVGIEDFTDNNIKIYTYNKQLFIKDIDSDIYENSKVLIYNTSGQIIKETIIKDVIDLSVDGIYIVVIKDKSGNIIKSKKVYIL